MERDKIEAIVSNLQRSLELEVPIDFNKFDNILSDLTIQYNCKDLDVDGRISKDEIGNYVVQLKNDGQSPRDRFTLAHELGHLFLGHVDQYETLYRRGANELEYAANEFAADLLMPKDIFNTKVDEYTNSDNICNITEVSNFCGVSESAIVTRGRFLGRFPWK